MNTVRVEQVRPPKTLRRHIGRLPNVTALPLEVDRLLDGIVRVELPDGRAVLLQRIPPRKDLPGGSFAAVLTETK